MIQDLLRDRYEECLDGLDIYENKNSLVVPRIVVKKECRSMGIGTKIMEDIIAYADSNKQIVALTPSSDFGGNKMRLVQFYKRFGFKANKGQYKSFEFRETMIRYPKMNESIKGGLADNLTKKDIAKKFNIKLSELEKEIKAGIKVELEHTDSKETAEEIAMDHLTEMPDYYTRLDKMEKESEDFWKGRLKESVARELRKLI